MSLEKNRTMIERIVVTAILAAIIIVLQTFASAIKIGPFSITLSLVPIILGAVLYGPIVGALLGTVFGAVVCVAVVTGADPGGFIMFQSLPVLTLALCVLKSAVAGFAAGLVYKALAKINLLFGVEITGKPARAATLNLGVVAAAIVCPVCNTGILSVGMLAFYREIVKGWAGDSGYDSIILYILLGVVGVNFIVETLINLVLTPAIVRVIKAVKKA